MAAKNNFEVGFVFGAKKAATFDKAFGSVNKSISGIVKGIAGIAGAYVGVKALTDTASQALKSASSLEGYRSTLNVVMKDSEKAAQTMQWAVDFANKTPFETDSIVEATVRLESYGLKAQEVMPQIGDMAGVMNKDIMQAVEAVADAQTGELERMKEFGITKAMLTEKAAEMYRGIEVVNAKGQIVDQEKFNTAMFALMEDRFSGGMEIQAGSFKGLMSTVQGVWKTGLASMAGMSSKGEIIDGSMFDIAKESIAGVAESLQTMAASGAFEKIGVSLGNGLTFVINGIKQIASVVIPIVTRLKDRAVEAFTWISDIAQRSFGKIQAVISENSGKFEAFGAAVKDVGGKVKDILEKGLEAVKPIIEWIATEGLPKAVDALGEVAGKATEIYNFITENWESVKSIIIDIGLAFVAWNLPNVLAGAVQGIMNFSAQIIGLPAKVGKATVAMWSMVKAKVADKVETLQLVGLYAKDFATAIWGNVKAVGESTKKWIADKAAIIGDKAAAVGHKAVDMASSIWKTVKSVAANTGAWITNKKAIIADKAAAVGHKAVDMASSMWKTVKSVAATTGAWVANKLAMIGSKVATLALKGVQLASTAVTAGMTAAQWALNAAFIASPIGWIVLGIGALIAVGVLLWKNWDVIKAKGMELWVKMQVVFINIQNYFGAMVTGLANKFPLLATALSGPVETIKGIFNGLKDVFTGIIDFVTGVFTGDWQKAWEGVKGIFGGIFDTFASLAKAPINGVIGIINAAIEGINGINVEVPDWVPGMGGKTFGFAIPSIPMLAEGGIATAPTLAMVGEGKEKEAILPLSRLQGMLSDNNLSAVMSSFMAMVQQVLAVVSAGGGGGTVTFAPQLVFNGPADRDMVNTAVGEAYQEFKQFMARYEQDKRRTAMRRG